MNDEFLTVTGVATEAAAMADSLNSAIQQRQNKVYAQEEGGSERQEFKAAWATSMRDKAKNYQSSVSDADHCKVIRDLSKEISERFGNILQGGKLRYGTSQKAFNLYLKYLWRLGIVPTPPHCPVDNIVLVAGEIIGSWTALDDEEKYCEWIEILKRRARPRSLSEWENEIWLLEWKRRNSKQNQCPPSS